MARLLDIVQEESAARELSGNTENNTFHMPRKSGLLVCGGEFACPVPALIEGPPPYSTPAMPTLRVLVSGYYFCAHLLDGVLHHALGLLEQGEPRGDHRLLEQPAVLGGAVVVDAVDQLPAEEGAEATQDAVPQARRADGAAVRQKKVDEGGEGGG